jgi:hypothetical protein
MEGKDGVEAKDADAATVTIDGLMVCAITVLVFSFHHYLFLSWRAVR